VPPLPQPLTLPPGQLKTLRSAMRDLQVSIGDYYWCSEGFVEADVLATPVRSSIGFVQVLNELLRKQTSRAAEYRAIFEPPADPRAGIIQAFEYVRHVTQHIDPVRPQSAATFGGASLGFRTYAIWKEVPSSVHGRLTSTTKALKPTYEHHLQGQEVVGTLLNAARFFAEVCPDLVHRQANGEWTGFPLGHQPGVSSRLHPEEPDDQVAALAWMARRRPGGDRRVVCGSLTDVTKGPILFGLTFTNRCAFVPFFETADQVNDDIALKFEYYEADVAANTLEKGSEFGMPAGRSVLCSEKPVPHWAGVPLNEAPRKEDHATFGGIDLWRSLWLQEASPGSQSFLTRRERRLNASLPHL
jgi:hypothetical protein